MSKRVLTTTIGAVLLLLVIAGGIYWWNQGEEPGSDADAVIDGNDKLSKLEDPCEFVDGDKIADMHLREVGKHKDLGGQKNCAWTPDDEDPVHTLGIAVSRSDVPGPAGWDEVSLVGIKDPIQRAGGQQRCDVAWPTSYGHAKLVGLAAEDARITCEELIDTTEPLISDIPE